VKAVTGRLIDPSRRPALFAGPVGPERRSRAVAQPIEQREYSSRACDEGRPFLLTPVTDGGDGFSNTRPYRMGTLIAAWSAR